MKYETDVLLLLLLLFEIIPNESVPLNEYRLQKPRIWKT